MTNVRIQPFFFASGAEFDEMFVGVGAKRMRNLFKAAREKQPAIIFIDELDAIGTKRSARDQQHMKQTLNQLLVEMDGFSPADGIVVIAATNFPQSLDNALVRPGRFDKKITVPLPDIRGREQILRHHLRNTKLEPSIDVSIIARGTSGFSGADLENLCKWVARVHSVGEILTSLIAKRRSRRRKMASNTLLASTWSGPGYVLTVNPVRVSSILSSGPNHHGRRTP